MKRFGILINRKKLIPVFWFVLPVVIGLFLIYAINSPYFPSLSGKTGNGYSYGYSISADGRLIAFVSNDAHLPDGDNNKRSVYVFDNQTGAATLVSTNAAGEAADASSGSETALPAISADGSKVVFYSRASNLVPGIAGGLFEKDLKSGEVKLVDDMTMQAAPLDMPDTETAVSADGRFVIFTSSQGIFLHDGDADKTVRVDVDASGKALPGSFPGPTTPSISSDGRFVAFTAYTSSAGQQGVPQSEVYIKDMQTGKLQSESADDNWHSGLDGTVSAISADGNLLLYLVGGQIELKDLRNGKTVKIADAGEVPALSPNGRYVAYQIHSPGSNAPGSGKCEDTANCPNIYLYDTQVGSRRQVVAPASWSEIYHDPRRMAVDNDGTVVFTAAAGFAGIEPEKCVLGRDQGYSQPEQFDCTNVFRRDVSSGDLVMVSGTGGSTVIPVPEWHPPRYYNSAVMDSLSQAGQAQERFRASRGKYAQNMADLKDFGFSPPEDVRATITSASPVDYCISAAAREGGSTWYISNRSQSPTTSACE